MESLRHLAGLHGQRAAVFDADGVLWRGDVSEDFTRWMIEQGHFDGGLWDSYHADNQRDPGAGCLSILRFYEGLELGAVSELVAEFWRVRGPRRWIHSTVRAIEWLTDAGFSVYVVSGTPRLVLDPLAEHLPLPPEHILALELATDHANRATGAHRGIATHGPGKAQAIRNATDAPVYLAAGNSRIDIEMLRLSIDVRWAIEPDDDLRAAATQARWTIIDDPALTQ